MLLHPGDKDKMKIIHLTGDKDVKGAGFSDQVIKSQTKELAFLAEKKIFGPEMIQKGKSRPKLVTNGQ